MRRYLVASLVAVTMAMVAAGGAVGQEADPSGLTGLEPLTRIVEGFAAGDTGEGLYLEGENDGGPTGLSQFQVTVNFGGSPAFGDDGLEMVPSGLSADGGLVSLVEQFGGTLGTTSMLPPLAPFARGQAMDVTQVFEGWTAYDTQGLVEGPIELLDGLHVVAGIELAEPYDPECSERTYVGRAWVGSTVSAPDPLFTEEALTNKYADDSHGVLVGRASRVIELGCFPGGGSVMLSSRMKEDSGIRPFGPLEIYGLVNGNHVVLITPLRVLDADLTQRFYASPQGGGPVVLSEVEDEPRLLVPNPYGPNDIRIELEVMQQSSDVDAASTGGTEGQNQTLLYQEGTGGIVAAQSGGGCTFIDRLFHLLLGQLEHDLDIHEDLFGSDMFTDSLRDMIAFGPASSSSGAVGADGDQLTSTVTTAGGATQTTVLNSDGTGEVSVTRGGSVPCVIEVTAISTPNIFVATGDTSDGSGTDTSDDGVDDDPADDEAADEAGTNDDTGGAGGVPWGPIGIAIILLGAAAATAHTRRTRTKDCKPEEQAYAAALAAYKTAKTVSDYYIGEFNHYNGEYNDYNNALKYRLDAPDRVRGFREGPEGDEAYADAKARWDAQEAKAQRAEDNIDGAREAMEGAKRDMDEAIKAQDAAADTLKRANEALRACKGSAPGLPDDTDAPPPPSSGGDGPSTGPGIISEPPETPEPKCVEGSTRVEIVSGSEKTYEVLGGPVEVNAGSADWARDFPNGIDATDLESMDADDLVEYFRNLDTWQAEKPTIGAKVPIDILTVRCIRVFVCSNGDWVETTESTRVEERTPSSPASLRLKGGDAKRMLELVKMVNAKVVELNANAVRAASHTCD